MYAEIYRLLDRAPELMVLYNGPKCGASAPDHAHLQAGIPQRLPLIDSWQRLSREMTPVIKFSDDAYISVINEYPCPALLIHSKTEDKGTQLFQRLYQALPCRSGDTEPMMNIIAWRRNDDYMVVVFPRAKHRPDNYGDVMVSPGAIDMAGLIITPREEDFQKLTAEQAVKLLQEVALPKAEFDHVVERLQATPQAAAAKPQNAKEPTVSVGIVSGQEIAFTLNGKAWFGLGEDEHEKMINKLYCIE
jgi:ATP adenylyltransferase/5',5'''-P-1,P-4-tetraphosphate phosphorylase II